MTLHLSFRKLMRLGNLRFGQTTAVAICPNTFRIVPRIVILRKHLYCLPRDVMSSVRISQITAPRDMPMGMVGMFFWRKQNITTLSIAFGEAYLLYNLDKLFSKTLVYPISKYYYSYL
jgi:hypothetical protein